MRQRKGESLRDVMLRFKYEVYLSTGSCTPNWIANRTQSKTHQTLDIIDQLHGKSFEEMFEVLAPLDDRKIREIRAALSVAGRLRTSEERTEGNRDKRDVEQNSTLGVVKSQPAAKPPLLGEILICLFERPDRHGERLADFAERFQTVWLPRFSPRVAKLIYLKHAIGTATGFLRVMAWGAVMDWFARTIGKFMVGG